MKYTLTIDPGLINWAWVIFDENGKIFKNKNIKLNNKKTQDKRLNEIYGEISNLSKIENVKIETAILEKQFMNLMIQITGVLKAACDSLNCEVAFFVPAEWKKLATGKGNIDEKELRDKIIIKYPEAENFSEHEIDCVGIYLAYKEKLLNPPVKIKKPKKEKKEESNVNVSKSTKRSPKKQKSS